MAQELPGWAGLERVNFRSGWPRHDLESFDEIKKYLIKAVGHLEDGDAACRYLEEELQPLPGILDLSSLDHAAASANLNRLRQDEALTAAPKVIHGQWMLGSLIIAKVLSDPLHNSRANELSKRAYRFRGAGVARESETYSLTVQAGSIVDLVDRLSPLYLYGTEAREMVEEVRQSTPPLLEGLAAQRQQAAILAQDANEYQQQL